MTKVFIEIDKCDDCPYLDHSGSFTSGGAKQICGHNEASEKATRNKKFKTPAALYHWHHRRISANLKTGNLIIPRWCPLRKEIIK